MSYDTPKLDQQQTLTFARTVLQSHLNLDIDGYQCTTEGLFNILLMMAAKQEIARGFLVRTVEQQYGCLTEIRGYAAPIL